MFYPIIKLVSLNTKVIHDIDFAWIEERKIWDEVGSVSRAASRNTTNMCVLI